MTDIKLVSEQSALALAKRHAGDDFDYALRVLTANLLRLTAGAGNRDELFRQIIICADKVENCRNLRMSPFDVELNLAYDGLRYIKGASAEDRARWSDTFVEERAYANHTIIIEALRVAAGEMLGQVSLAKRAGSQLYQAIDRLSEANAQYYRSLGLAPKPRRKAKRGARKPISLSKTAGDDK